MIVIDICILWIAGKWSFLEFNMKPGVNDNWYPVVRYDNAHGFAHRDLLTIQGEVKKTPLFHLNFEEALTFAESDLKLNWGNYRKIFLGEAYD